MTLEDFMKKWSCHKEIRGTLWAGNHNSILWALTYKIETEESLELAKDFLSISDTADWNCQCLDRAKLIVRYHEGKVKNAV